MSFWRSLGLTREKKSNLEVLGWDLAPVTFVLFCCFLGEGGPE